MRVSPASACVVTLLTVAACAPQPASEPAATAFSAAADHIRAVSFTDVQLQDAFWKPRFERNRDVTIPHIMEQNELTGRVDNFRKGAVRAAYLYSGMADVAARTDAPGYDEALDAIWNDVVSSELYITGSIGTFTPSTGAHPVLRLGQPGCGRDGGVVADAERHAVAAPC